MRIYLFFDGEVGDVLRSLRELEVEDLLRSLRELHMEDLLR